MRFLLWLETIFLMYFRYVFYYMKIVWIPLYFSLKGNKSS